MYGGGPSSRVHSVHPFISSQSPLLICFRALSVWVAPFVLDGFRVGFGAKEVLGVAHRPDLEGFVYHFVAGGSIRFSLAPSWL